MGFFTSGGRFDVRSTGAPTSTVTWVTQGTESAFRYVFLLTVCPDDMTLTPRTSGTYDPPGVQPSGEIGDVSLLETQTADGYTVQVWERVGVGSFGSSIVYYVFDYSRTLAETSAGVQPTDFTFALYASFNGCVDHYYDLRTFTGGPTQDTGTVDEVVGSGWDVDAAILGYVVESSNDSGVSLPTFSAPMVGGAAVGFNSSTVGDVSGVVGDLADLDAPIGPFTMIETGSTWAHGALALFGGVDVVGSAVVTGWRIGRVAAGVSAW